MPLIKFQICLCLFLAVAPRDALGRALPAPGATDPSAMEASAAPGKTLPYVARGDTLRPDRYPQWGLSLGMAATSVDLKGIRQAITATRDEAAARGYTIGERSPKTTIGTMLYTDLRCRFSSTWTGALQVATGHGSGVQRFTLTSFNALWSPSCRRHSGPRVSPLLTVGPTFYMFRSKVRYGIDSRVSPIDGVSFYYLDKVELRGRAWGVKGGGSVNITGSHTAALSATLEYAWFPVIRNRGVVGRPAAINASSTFGSVRFSF